MKKMVFTAVAALLFASSAFAQEATVRPGVPPADNAPYEERELWCDLEVRWFLAQPNPELEETPDDLPADHAYRQEMSGCLSGSATAYRLDLNYRIEVRNN